VRLLRRAGLRNGLVADLGCGTGIASRALVDAGYAVLGVDISPDALEIARRRVPEATFVERAVLDAELPPCVGVAAIGEVVNYLADRRAGAAGLGRLARRIRGALEPGGILLLDVAEPGRERGIAPRRTWHEGEGWLVALEAAEDREAATLRRRITVFRDEGAGWRRTDEVHELALLERRAVLAELAAAGFAARPLSGYGRAVRFRRGHIGIEAAAAGRPRAAIPSARKAASTPSAPAPRNASS
jgi:SAM-dependent methyltransferase